MDRVRQAVGDDRLNYLGLLLRHRARRGVRPPVPEAGPRHGARRRGRPDHRRHPVLRRPAAGLREGLRPVRRLLPPHLPVLAARRPPQRRPGRAHQGLGAPDPDQHPGRRPPCHDLAGPLRRAVRAVLPVHLARAGPRAAAGTRRRLQRPARAVRQLQRARPGPLREPRAPRTSPSGATTPTAARATPASAPPPGPGPTGSRCSVSGRPPPCSTASSGSPTAPRCPDRPRPPRTPCSSWATSTTRPPPTRGPRTWRV